MKLCLQYRRETFSVENNLRHYDINLTSHGEWIVFIFNLIINLIKMYEYYVCAQWSDIFILVCITFFFNSRAQSDYFAHFFGLVLVVVTMV